MFECTGQRWVNVKEITVRRSTKYEYEVDTFDSANRTKYAVRSYRARAAKAAPSRCPSLRNAARCRCATPRTGGGAPAEHCHLYLSNIIPSLTTRLFSSFTHIRVTTTVLLPRPPRTAPSSSWPEPPQRNGVRRPPDHHGDQPVAPQHQDGRPPS